MISLTASILQPYEAIQARARVDQTSVFWDFDDWNLDKAGNSVIGMQVAIVFVNSDSGEVGRLRLIPNHWNITFPRVTSLSMGMRAIGRTLLHGIRAMNLFWLSLLKTTTPSLSPTLLVL
jgi:hypothetical protein